MAQLFDPFHPCPACNQPTDNVNMCDDCIDNMAFMLRRYEADVRSKREQSSSSYHGA